MTRRKKDPLRTLTEEERNWWERISRAHSEPATHVAHAKVILAVADGCSYTEAAQKAGTHKRRPEGFFEEFEHPAVFGTFFLIADKVQ